MKYFDTDSFQEIWATITRNKFRSVATGFGVFWGLFMLIVLLAVGNKFQQSIMAQISGLATNSVVMWTERTSEPYAGYRKGRYWGFRTADLDVIKRKAPSVDLISPFMWAGGGDKNVVRGIRSGSYRVGGLYPDYYRISQVVVESGRLINEVDMAERRKVCIIGKKVYETLFAPGESIEGQFIRINGIYFKVVGVISPVSNASMFGSVDEAVHLPFLTAQMLFSRSDQFWVMALTAKPGYPAEQVETEVREIIKTRHSIAPTGAKAVGSQNLEHQFRMFQMVFTGINVLMWIVGLGALFSGIIGISNIMLVTVRERMREIGVRRALGAKPWNIIVQIMSESFVLTAIAGLAGFMLGIGVSLLIEKIDFGGGGIPGLSQPVVSFNLALVAMLVLMLSGVAAGLLPAWRALKIKAIDAIRDE